MKTASTSKNHETNVPVRTIYEKLGEYYDREQIDYILEGILKKLGFRQKESYNRADFLEICRELKNVGGNARFCASLLIIDVILKKIVAEC
ncbi:MAG TPA: hypothetical protein VIH20_05470 [Candidatus Subteraquimicrobiales bacterium]